MNEHLIQSQLPEEATEREQLVRSAFELLEFPRVRQMLAGKTRFFRSSELALAIDPQLHSEDVVRLQEETAEAVLMLDTVGDIGLTGHEDLRPLLRRAGLGGTLTGQELISVVRLLESMELARDVVLSMNGKAPHMELIAGYIPHFHELRKEVNGALADTGDVKDSATPRLGRLRRDAARAYQRLLNIIERIIASPDVRSSLQSPSIATRSERLVIEVRSDSREHVPGIVHDVSNTGATLFVEPFRAVEPCNSWREMAAEAQREEERVLRRLTAMLGELEELALIAIDAAADIDLITAKARLARTMGATRPETLERGADPAVRLVSARHPLLAESAVPVSISVGPGFRGMVITGPNTGGKTVALKTMGLLALMHQSGLQIPAKDGSALATFSAIYADIGDAQSIDRSVSTFSSHMGRVIQVLEHADSESLVLLDELGTGTDPEEGSALARAVLENLLERNIPVAVTTHHRAVAEFAGSHEKAMNASVELDPTTLMPSYRFIMGVPGRSYAIHVARNLGLPEPVLENAESMLDPRRAEAESLLDQIQRERNALHEAREKAEQDMIAAERARQELEKRLNQIARQQDDLVQRTRMQLRREADDVRNQLRRIVAQAETDRDLAVAQRAVNRLRTALTQPNWLPVAPPEERTPEAPPQIEDRPLQAGDDVEIKGLNVRARVISIKADGTADLQMGNARIQLDARQLRRVEAVPEERRPGDSQVQVKRVSAGPVEDELDVRGKRVADIEEMLPGFIDRCTADGLSSCKIIHGAGTGALRQSVRDILARLPQAASFAPAPREQGGNGVTLVELN
jgi:DNA mismatch repair protein MutS2